MPKKIVHVRERRRPETGRLQCLQESGGVLLRRVDEDVEIERGPGNAVEDGGNPSDDDVSNVVGGEGCEYVA